MSVDLNQRLIQIAVASGWSYGIALMAAHDTAKEVGEFDTAELVDRLFARCRTAPLTEQLMLTVRAAR